MRRRAELENPAGDMRLQYIMAAAWFYLKASSADENLVSALNRTQASQLLTDLMRHGLPIPTAQDIYAYAAERWPSFRLHPAPEATAQ